MLLHCARLKSESGRSFCGQKCRDRIGGCLSCLKIPSAQQLLDRMDPKLTDNQNQYVKEVKPAIAQGDATLVLGAGISIPAGMPGWRELIAQMVGYAVQCEVTSDEFGTSGGSVDQDKRRAKAELVKILMLDRLSILGSTNVLEAGQYIQESASYSYTSGQAGEELLKDAMSTIIEKSSTPKKMLEDYERKNGISGKIDRADPHAMAAIAESNTLFAVSYLLKKHFHQALTYNYDPLVQECLLDVFGVDAGSSIITHPGKWSDTHPAQKDIQIFHVHGYIPRKGQAEDNVTFPKESDSIILSEDSYYNMEQFGAYDWQNSIQTYYLNRDCCLFVGFSAEDYNFRRILRNLGNGEGKGKKHYLILTIDPLVTETWESVCRHHIKRRKHASQIEQDTLLLLERELKMKERYWEKYNFYPIWVTIQDIPKLLLSFA